jgi:hypothetical protein
MKYTIKALANLIPEGLDTTGDNDDDPIALSQLKTRMDPYNASSEDDEKYFTPLKKKQLVKAPGAFKLLPESKKQKNILFFDSEDDEDELATSTPRGRERIRKAAKDSEDENEEAGISTQETDGTTSKDEDKGDEDKSPVVSTVRRKSRPILIISDDEDDAPPLPKLRQPSVLNRKGNKGKGRTAIDPDDSDDDDKIITASPSKRRRSIAIPDDYEDDDDEPAISPLKRRKQDVESDDSDIGSSHPKHSRSTAAEDSEDEDENEDEESGVPRGRTRAAHRKKQSSISPYTPSRYTRQANPPKKHRTAKQKAAELLRRKRAGEKIDQLTESSSDAEDSRGLYDSDSELEALHVFEDEESSPESVRPATRSDSRQSEGNDANNYDEDEGFIVDDDEDHLLGTSCWAAIPIC